MGYQYLSYIFQYNAYAVCMFFVLSGYVLTRSYDGHYWAFLTKRFLRLWPLSAICLSLGYLALGQTPLWTHYVWWPVVNANNSYPEDVPIWSLTVEAWATPLIPIFIGIGRSRGIKKIFGITLVVSIMLLCAHFKQNIYYTIITTFSLYCLCGAMLSPIDLRFRPLNNAVFQYLGRISYALYLIHCPILTIFIHFGSAFVPLASWLLTVYVDEPCTRFSRKAGAYVSALSRS